MVITQLFIIFGNSSKSEILNWNIMGFNQGIHPKTQPLANSTTYKNHIIVRKEFSLIETTESCKQLPNYCKVKHLQTQIVSKYLKTKQSKKIELLVGVCKKASIP